MRGALAGGVWAVMAAAQVVHAQEAQVQFDIAAQPLANALGAFGQQARQQVLFDEADVAGRSARAVRGSLSPRQALEQLLAGSGVAIAGAKAGGFALKALPPAQKQSLDHSLESVTVTANQLGEITEGTGSYTPGTIATATRLVLAPRETPQSISVITRQEMDDFNLRAIDDVMRHTPGVSTVTYDTERTEYYARGFSINEFQYDGIPMTRNSRYSAGNTLSDMAIYDRVEVLKGATGLLTGAGNPGATINLIRKKPTKDFQGHATLGAGSWDNYRGELDISGSLNTSGSVRARAVAAHQDKKSYMDHYQRKTDMLFGTLEADLSPNTLLTIGADYQNSAPKGSTWGGIRLFDSAGNFNAVPRSFNNGARWAHWDQSTKTAFATLEHHFSNGWVGKVQFNHQINGYDSELGSPNGYMMYPDRATGAGVTMAGWMGQYRGDVKSNALDAYLSGPFSLLGREHELVVGASVSRQELAGENHWQPASYDVSVPNYYAWDGNIAKPDWYLARLVNETTRQSGVYGTARFNLRDDLKLILGSRVSNYDYVYTYAAPGTAAVPTNKKESGVVVPYMGLVYDLSSHWSLYASHTSIFQPQSNEDAGGARLDPLKGNSYEVGAKSQFFNGRLNTSLAYFETHQDNFAQRTSGRTPSGGAAYRAVDGVVTKGVDAEVSGKLTENWQLHAGYTHKVARRDGAKVTTIEPEDQFHLYTSYQWGGSLRGLTTGAGARWQGKSWDDVNHPTNGYSRFTMPSYWLVDLMASYRVNKNLMASVHINNAFDKKYHTLMSIYDVYSWGEPRSVSVSMRYDF
ncbi:TonB-dependent siderophore receptor [Acidovorax sp. CCYZU-2555]|uniref:TonB-dependent siderophore receptor n=1 Tax=Acidovorax sp. CCYZU-2555 TaxID=2835042 RepID=UPI0020C0A261|nr:TonB-dependent siderophore receptor [Acidovorax sp. CCYZU-2555]